MVSTRSSKDVSPGIPSHDSDAQADSPPSPPAKSPINPSTKRRRRSGRKTESQSPSSGGDSPKSDTSTREKMRKTKIEESVDTTAPQTISSQSTGDEMVDVHVGELSPGGKGRKRTHDEIASASKDAKTPKSDTEDRPPSRAANGEPVGKKLRETPSPPREVIDETCMFENIPREILNHLAGLSNWFAWAVGRAEAPSAHSSRANAAAGAPLPISMESDSELGQNDHSNNDYTGNDTSTSSSILSSPAHEASEPRGFAIPTSRYKRLKPTDKRKAATTEKLAPKEDETPMKDVELVEPKEEPKEAPKEEHKSKLSGGFSNTSVVSPFGALATKPTETPTPETNSNTNQSGFAASRFSSFSNVTSPFGVSPSPLAPSPFGGPPIGSDNVFSKMSSTTGQSSFLGPPVGSANVFAKLSGNAAVSGFGSVSSPFASGGSSIFGNPLSSKPLPKAQPLEGLKGSTKVDTESHTSDNEDEDGSSAGADGLEPGNVKNPVFAAKQAVKSGEEEYDMIFQGRAKLFEYSGGAWKERGIGNIRILTPKLEEEVKDNSKKVVVARLVMRQEGVGRLILNASLFKDMLVSGGKSHSDNTIRFLAVNSVTFGEIQEEKPTDDNDKPEMKDKEGASKKSPSESAPSSDPKPALKTYLLRFKSKDMVEEFREGVEANWPV
ncbi:hypothetical protein H072_8878 [Dactylellina haptotyla CBS 200.50]|uniref:RanBD1 domain-containing protein n=1 Tax=Dactylellina haptotyla (strain CBS 200.50) TaxID=1284197 RepID=S8A3T4_DACHA|nr:hypothetical protein H072_8878 [Dactylellina haptotyla CBS 200.50]